MNASKVLQLARFPYPQYITLSAANPSSLSFPPLHGPRLLSSSAAVELAPDPSEDSVEDLLAGGVDRVRRLMKMERKPHTLATGNRWFPYLDSFRSGSAALGSAEVIEALDPYIMGARKERIRRAVDNRSYSVCLVVEGLMDFGNVSAAFRSADALGIQSVHVISGGSRKRCKL